ncbi:FUSC family protein, partial [Nonomuraea rhizosphaerae]|uniref:FUSC family protein n=1 Tax=Nonomuraea rhizosphaerae TaxID=2665663 RepID=UPI001C5D863E
MRVQESLSRLRLMAPSIGQCAVGAALAWLVAKDVLHHGRPFFAPIAVIICIGVGLGRRLRRMGEMVVGVSLGVGVSDLLVSWIGSGAWQITFVVALAMTAAVLLDNGQLIVAQSGSSGVLVATLLPPSGTGGLDRMADAAVGGVVGLAMVALLPVNPATLVARHAAGMFDALVDVLRRIADALDEGPDESADRGPTGRGSDDKGPADKGPADEALEAARATHASVEEFKQAVATSREIATISPLHRSRRSRLDGYERAAVPLDHAFRNLRVLARRVVAATGRPGVPPPWLPGALRELADAVPTLREDLARGRDPERARQAILAAARRQEAERGGVSAGVRVGQFP